MRRVIRKRIRRSQDGIDLAVDFNADIAVNVGGSRQSTTSKTTAETAGRAPRTLHHPKATTRRGTGPREGGATFISTGDQAFVEVAGTAYRLPTAQADSLAGTAGAVRSGARLPLGRWLQDPSVEDGGEVGGTETDRVTAKLDARPPCGTSSRRPEAPEPTFPTSPARGPTSCAARSRTPRSRSGPARTIACCAGCGCASASGSAPRRRCAGSSASSWAVGWRWTSTSPA